MPGGRKGGERALLRTMRAGETGCIRLVLFDGQGRLRKQDEVETP